MARILTVDDSRSVRLIVRKQLQELGHEVDEAEDGELGWAKLQELKFDLVILDVTMPVLDGPGMLAKLREAGDKTPVLMLTSESKRSIVAALMKLGINDYILKPFKPEELKGKVANALGGDNAAARAAVVADDPAIVQRPSVAAGAGQSGAGGATPADAGRQFVDILLIDDMENVQKRLRAMIPEHITLNGVLGAQAAMTTCRDRVFRVLLIDTDIPDVNSASLMRQLRLLQPHAAFVALSLRSTNNVQEEARTAGFDGLLFKPFDAAGVEDFLIRYFNNQDLVSKDDNTVRVAAFRGRESRLDGYFLQVTQLMVSSAEAIASACFGEMIIDITGLPSVPAKVTRLVMDVQNKIQPMGLELRLVGGPEIKKVLKQYAETAELPLFTTVAEALEHQAA